MTASTIQEIEEAEMDEEEIWEVDPNHPARPMKVVFDGTGNHWLCDKGVDVRGDLAAQGCWRCGDFPFTRQD
jgi:hypothetical protein